ncbi:MAG TPA: calcineurin-like phosphoesterase C-terminal domain-containing protein, partial [Candidatus Hydrogenedentes bacterium]|nr:calcineurin-like phosphoesterase C-terminal domain-containing protein [Candidatus Hydrogenedentota bacterium]
TSSSAIRPDGSPKMKYAGSAPTGPLPASVDFPLYRHKEPKKFKIICMGDTQVRNQEECDFLAHDMVEELQGTDAAFGVTLGDVVFNDLTVFGPMARSIGGIGVPWRHVIGNHDHNHDAPTEGTTEDSYEAYFGPATYAFNYGPVHFIALDDIWHNALKEEYHAELGAEKLAFIKNDLAHLDKGQLVVLMMHIPIMEIKDRRTLFDLLKEFPHTFSLSAHTHNQWQAFLGPESGWKQKEAHHHFNHGTACGCWWGGFFDEVSIPHATMMDGVPNGYSFITFNGSHYEVDYRAARRCPSYQMNIFTPEVIKAADAPKTEVIVNVFAGSSRSTVEMRVEDGKWTPMTQFKGLDPYYRQLHDRQGLFVKLMAERDKVQNVDNAYLGKLQREFGPILRGLSKPDETGHLWKQTLPAELTPGMHKIEVRTKDMFGHEYTANRILRVE